MSRLLQTLVLPGRTRGQGGGAGHAPVPGRVRGEGGDVGDAPPHVPEPVRHRHRLLALISPVPPLTGATVRRDLPRRGRHITDLRPPDPDETGVIMAKIRDMWGGLLYTAPARIWLRSPSSDMASRSRRYSSASISPRAS